MLLFYVSKQQTVNYINLVTKVDDQNQLNIKYLNLTWILLIQKKLKAK